MHIKKTIILVILLLLVPLSEMKKREFLRSESSHNPYSQYLDEMNEKGFMTEEEAKILQGLPGLEKEKEDELLWLALFFDFFVFMIFVLFSIFNLIKGHKVYSIVVLLLFFIANSIY